MYYELVGTVAAIQRLALPGGDDGPPNDKIKRMSDATIAGLERVIATMKPGCRAATWRRPGRARS